MQPELVKEPAKVRTQNQLVINLDSLLPQLLQMLLRQLVQKQTKQDDLAEMLRLFVARLYVAFFGIACVLMGFWWGWIYGAKP